MSLYLKKIPAKGRGVFADEEIEEGQLIEVCPVILISDETERALLKSTVLADYLFTWDNEKSVSAIALGYGSFYNHAVKANARYLMNYETSLIEICSVARIPAHQEITINYTGEWNGESLDWFLIIPGEQVVGKYCAF